jgi:aspartate 1-decarboxylase
VSGGVDAISGAGGATECSQIGDGVIVLCFSMSEAGEQGENSRERDLGIHDGGSVAERAFDIVKETASF